LVLFSCHTISKQMYLPLPDEKDSPKVGSTQFFGRTSYAPDLLLRAFSLNRFEVSFGSPTSNVRLQ
jgi:hypothetical protein